MERWYLRRNFATFNEFIFLEAALLTKANGAYIPAAITLDALGKFKIPLVKPLTYAKGIYSGHGIGCHSPRPFTFYKLFRIGFETLTGICEFLRTGDTNLFNLVWIQLVPRSQGIEPPFIATADEYPE